MGKGKRRGPRKGKNASRLLSRTDPSSRNLLSTTYTLSSQSLRPLSVREQECHEHFDHRFPELARLWDSLDALHRTLIEKRVELPDSSQLRSATELLGAKAFCDARAAQVLITKGYLLSSLRPL